MGHSGPVYTAVFSPDGGDLSSLIHHRRTNVGSSLKNFSSLTDWGCNLLTASHDRTVKIWDTTTLRSKTDMWKEAESMGANIRLQQVMTCQYCSLDLVQDWWLREDPSKDEGLASKMGLGSSDARGTGSTDVLAKVRSHNTQCSLFAGWEDDCNCNWWPWGWSSCDTLTKHCKLSFHVLGDYLGCCNSSTGAWFCHMKCFLMHDACELIGSEDLQPWKEGSWAHLLLCLTESTTLMMQFTHHGSPSYPFENKGLIKPY